ncbi:MAG: DNA polymerase I, partial [Hyphomicrobiaceae bacterium]|nr:DNA polymerase I [Hyphomicrobiaceae bacterium]
MASTSSNSVGPGDIVFLVDGSNFIFRAFFQSMNQDRKYNYRSDGLPTGAVRLFAAKLFQFVTEGALGIRPTHLAIIFDKSEDSFRKALYPPYKANRSEPPEDLVPQFPLMREAVRAFGLTPVEQVKYEADDLIATYARQAREAGAEVIIISADKDLMQLITDEKVSMYDPASGSAAKGKGYRAERRIGRDEVIDYFGVPPEKVVDCQALAGDSTDNVPGAPGIGVKTAAQLLSDFGDLETLLARAGEIKQPKRRETLTDPDVIEKVKISRELVKLVDDVPLEVPLADLAFHDPEAGPLIAFLKAMEFTTITRRVAERYEADIGAFEPEERLAKGGEDVPALADGSAPGADEAAPTAAEAGAMTPQALAASRAASARATGFDVEAYVCITAEGELKAWIEEGFRAGRIALDTETDGLDPQQAGLVGISLATAPGRAAYIPLAHTSGDGDLLSETTAPEQVRLDRAIALLKPLLEDASTLKVLQNAKFDLAILARHGIAVAPVDDTMLLSYAVDAGRGGHGMDDLSERHLGHTPIPYKAVAGTGKSAVTFDRIALDAATRYAAEDADVTLRLHDVLKPRVAAAGKLSVYERLERPLIAVLQRMEARGIKVDRAMLARLSGDFAQKMAGYEEEIRTLAGEDFNVGSPKQLGDILFGKMGLPGAKKTKTGAWATPADVLETLAAEGHALPRKVLDWRQLQKLRSTYTEALAAAINPETGRVHTSFSLASTTTGRLSSSDPNLQNIPVRTEEGRKIRRAFITDEGWRIVSADYSQIELR